MQDLDHILNWRRITAQITTSGQPNETQLAELKKLGVTHVMNLGPHDNKGALPDEPGTISSLGMAYIYIPVDFENPTDQNFEDFARELEALPDAKIHVHCIYNARVSAFFFRYAKDRKTISVEFAYKNMDSIWRPGKDWAEFIDDERAKSQANRYAGDDYQITNQV